MSHMNSRKIAPARMLTPMALFMAGTHQAQMMTVESVQKASRESAIVERDRIVKMVLDATNAGTLIPRPPYGQAYFHQ